MLELRQNLQGNWDFIYKIEAKDLILGIRLISFEIKVIAVMFILGKIN